MSRLAWYARRLRSMSPGEVAWRTSRAATGAARTLARRTEPSDAALLGVRDPDWEALLGRFRDGRGPGGAPRPVLLGRDRAAELAAAHPEQAKAVLAAADQVLAHRFGFFGYPEQTLDEPINWHHDPLSATTWPAVPSDRIDHRTAAGDPKWIWELNRLQHLPWLAQAWLITGDARYSTAALDQLDSWCAQNPPGVGIAWRGAFEAGIRAVSVTVALQGLRDAPELTAQRYRRGVRMLAESARRCWAQRSRFSSANNHLVGELAGLATVALLLPELAQAPAWEQRGLRALRTEAARQILPDGAGAEQAVGYQIFTAELLLVVIALLRLRGDRPPAELTDAVHRSACYLAALVGDNDPAPRYGDDDEGFALRLDAAPVRTVRAHLAAVAAVTGNPAAARAGQPDLTAGWLAAARAGQPDLTAGWLAAAGPAGQAERAGQAGPAEQRAERPDGAGRAEDASAPASPSDAAPGSMFAAHGGLVLLRSGSRRITMDVGPLGYLSIAAHGHADALALTLSLDGQDIIGDPGTASYYGHPDWRTAHRGTRAHATVCVDDADQSVLSGPFLWAEHAEVTVHAVDLERGIVDAEHTGYRRLHSPVTHRRWLIAPPDSPDVLIVDLLHGEGTHEVRSSWPLHPSLEAKPAPAGHLLTRNDAPVLQLGYAASAELSHHEVRGDPVGNLGWWSHRLESREPAWLVGARCQAPLPVALVTLAREWHRAPEHCYALTTSLGGEAIEVRWEGEGGVRGVRIDLNRPGCVQQVTPA